MGRIPEYREAPARSTLQTQRINIAGSTARAAGKFAETIGEVVQKKQDIQENNYINLKSLEMENKAKSLFEEHQKANSANPNNTYGAYKEKLSLELNALMDDAPNGRAKSRLSQSSVMLQESMRGHVDNWESEQIVRNTGEAAEEGLNIVKTEALRLKDPRALEALKKKGQPFIGNLDGVARADLVEKTKKDFNQSLAVNSFTGLILEGNIEAAEKLLESKQYDEDLGAGGVEKIKKEILREKASRKTKKENLERLKYSDSWKYLQKIGDIAGYTPLDMSDPESLPQKFEQRAKYIEGVEKRHKFAEIPMMPKEEQLMFMQYLTTGSIEEKHERLQAIEQSLTGDQYQRFTKQIFSKSKELGMAMAYAIDDPELSKDIISGHRIMKSKTVDADEATLKSSFSTALKESIPDVETKDSLYQAVKAYAVSKAHERGSSVVDSEDIEKGIERLTGPLVEINGRNTLSFRSGGKIFTDLEDFYEDEITKEEIEIMHKDLPRDSTGSFIDIDDIKDDYSLELRGDGVYALKDPSGDHAADKNGDVFLLDIKSIYEKRKNKK